MDGKKLLIPTIAVGLLTVMLLAIVHIKGGNSVGAAQEGLTSLVKVLPVLAFALVAASCLVYLVPAEFVAKWVGKDSGAKGIFVASIAGMIVPPGGPIVVYAIAAGLIKAGAGFATMVAFVTAYNLLAVHRFPFELQPIWIEGLRHQSPLANEQQASRGKVGVGGGSQEIEIDRPIQGSDPHRVVVARSRSPSKIEKSVAIGKKERVPMAVVTGVFVQLCDGYAITPCGGNTKYSTVRGG